MRGLGLGRAPEQAHVRRAAWHLNGNSERRPLLLGLCSRYNGLLSVLSHERQSLGTDCGNHHHAAPERNSVVEQLARAGVIRRCRMHCSAADYSAISPAIVPAFLVTARSAAQ